MSNMESWDDDDFEPTDIKTTKPVLTASANKWEGEDEDDDVKDCWEDEEEEKEKSDKSDEKPVLQSKPKKKNLQEKIAEKERMKREEIEKRLKEQEEEEMTPEEKLRMQKESDLELALETTFGDRDNQGGDFNADNACPTTKEEFDEFANALMKKIQPLSKSAEYPNFSENLIRSICVTLTSFDLKKIKTTIDNLYLEKQKIEKGDKAKKNKGKGKVKLKVEDSNQYSAYVDYDDEFDDFM